MLANAFVGRDHAPSHHDLATTLGSSEQLWRRTILNLCSAGVTDSKDWRSYSAKAGWTLRLKRKERVIVYLSPAIGCFTASLILGDKALASLDYRELPSSAVKLIKEAKRYPEGTAIRLEVHNDADIELLKKLAVAKARH